MRMGRTLMAHIAIDLGEAMHALRIELFDHFEMGRGGFKRFKIATFEVIHMVAMSTGHPKLARNIHHILANGVVIHRIKVGGKAKIAKNQSTQSCKA